MQEAGYHDSLWMAALEVGLEEGAAEIRSQVSLINSGERTWTHVLKRRANRLATPTWNHRRKGILDEMLPILLVR